MTRKAKDEAGAAPRTEYPPFGDQTLRREWTRRLTQVSALDAALALLLDWRRGRDVNVLEETDFLWIESRIEDRVAVLRFTELSGDYIDTTTLTGASIAEVCESALAIAAATADVPTIEQVVNTFRREYKPPVMPTVPFMRTETELAELLMKRRSKGWYDESLDELRRRRAAVLVPEGAAGEHDN
jgi:methane monooxygenase component A gamma chain